MAQFSRPSADDTDGNFTAQDGSTVLYLVIDETVADNADYIRSGVEINGDTTKIKLSTVGDPVSASSHILRYRLNKVGTATAEVFVMLYEGLTLRATFRHFTISDTITDYAQTLSAGTANSITDYSNLYIAFETHFNYPAIASLEYVGTFDEIRNRSNSYPQDRAIQALYVMDDELVPAYGDYNLNSSAGSGIHPKIMSMNPDTGSVTTHDTIETEYFGVYQRANGDVFVWWQDPEVGSWPIYSKRIAGSWSNGGSSPAGVHMFDMIEWGSALYMCGSRNGQTLADEGMVWKSTDGGSTWTLDFEGPESATFARFYTFFPYSDRLYVKPQAAGTSSWYTTGSGGWIEDTTGFGAVSGTSAPNLFEWNGYLYRRGTENGTFSYSNNGNLTSGPSTWTRAPIDRSAGFGGSQFNSFGYYDLVPYNTNRVYGTRFDGVLMSLDANSVTSLISKSNLPFMCRPWAIVILNNTIYIGDMGGRVWRGSSAALPTRSGTLAVWNTTPTGWTENDTINKFNPSGGLFLSTTGGAWGNPRNIYTTSSFSRANDLRGEFGFWKMGTTNPKVICGFFTSNTPTDWSTAAAGLGYNGNSTRVRNDAGSATPVSVGDFFQSNTIDTPPGNEYRICIRDTGSVMYAKGVQLEPPYDDAGTTRAIWLPIAVELEDTTANLWFGFSADGSVNFEGQVNHNWAYNSGTPHAGDIEDDFTRADNASSLGSASIGGAWTGIGTVGINTNQAYSSDTSGTAQMGVINTGDSDGIIHADLSGIASSAIPGIVFRSDGTDQNYWVAYLDGTNLKVDKVVSGTPTNAYTLALASTSITLVVACYRDKITLWSGTGGNTLRTTMTDSALQTNTRWGVYFKQTAANARIDALRVYGPMAD